MAAEQARQAFSERVSTLRRLVEQRCAISGFGGHDAPFVEDEWPERSVCADRLRRVVR
jgi:hypothetical protein